MPDFDKLSMRRMLDGQNDEVLGIFDYLWDNQQKYPREKKYLSMVPLEPSSARALVRVVNFVAVPTKEQDAYAVVAVEIASGGKYSYLPFDGHGEAYDTFMQLFLTKHYANFITFCTNGRKGSFGPVIRQFYKPLLERGITVTPCSRPPTIDGIRFSQDPCEGNLSWEIRDWNSSFDTGDVHHLRNDMAHAIGREKMLFLLAEATRLSEYFKEHFSIKMKSTVARTGTAAIRTNVPREFIKTRPDPLLRSMLVNGHGARAGQQWAMPGSGRGFKIDRNKSYVSEFRWALPTHSTFVVCDQVEQHGHGHYLCHVSGYTPRPQQIALWDKTKREFIPIPFLRGSGYAVLQSVEFGFLERLGVKVTPIFGYSIDQWEKYGEFDELFVASQEDAHDDPLLKNYLKSIGVAFVGSMARQPEYDDVIYSEEEPEGDFWPLHSMDGQLMENWWVRTREGWSSTMQMDTAAWIWSCARESLMSLACDLMDINIWPVHCHTDSLIAPGVLPEGLPIGRGIGDWKIEGENRSYDIYGTGWYKYEGERPRQSGYDRRWQELSYDEELITQNERLYAEERHREEHGADEPSLLWHVDTHWAKEREHPVLPERWVQLMYTLHWTAHDPVPILS